MQIIKMINVKKQTFHDMLWKSLYPQQHPMGGLNYTSAVLCKKRLNVKQLLLIM